MSDHTTHTVHVPGLVLTEHEVTVPLDHAHGPDGEQITVFAREVADADGRDRPFLVFLQGGPGSEAPRPTRRPTGPGWLDRALQDYRVLMFDQRGTGRSTPVGTLPGRTPQQQADHLAHFRADSIVARRRAGPAGARGRPVERAGPVVRRVLLADLPVVRAREPARGVLHRRRAAGRPPRRRGVRRDVRDACSSATAATTRATPATATGCAAARAADAGEMRLPHGDADHLAPAAQASATRSA